MIASKDTLYSHFIKIEATEPIQSCFPFYNACLKSSFLSVIIPSITKFYVCIKIILILYVLWDVSVLLTWNFGVISSPGTMI